MAKLVRREVDETTLASATEVGTCAPDARQYAPASSIWLTGHVRQTNRDGAGDCLAARSRRP